MENENKTKFYLLRKDRIYRNRTLTTLHFRSGKQASEKKTKPIDIDGERYKLDLETGEITCYKKKECQLSLSKSVQRTKVLLNMLLEMNDFDWFCTLTFDRQKIDRKNDKAVFEAYRQYIRYSKRNIPELRYVCVPERHEDGCIHFHLLIGGVAPSKLGLVNSGKVCCSWAYAKSKIASREYFERTKDKYELSETDGLAVYNISSFSYGLTTATRIASREKCNSYVKKYINKALGTSTDIFKKRFYYSSNLQVPQIVDRLIGADFDAPSNLLSKTKTDPHIQNAIGYSYNEEHNILQFWEDNETKQQIENGLIPLSEEETKQIEEIFNERI